jgi:hypothetical protein
VALNICNNDTVMLAGRKYEILLEMQQHKGMIFTKYHPVTVTTEILHYSSNGTIKQNYYTAVESLRYMN